MKRIPVELRSTSSHYALEAWVKGKTCRLEDFFKVIDGAFELLEKANPTHDVEPSSVVAVLCETINSDGSLEDYVIEEKRRDVDEPEDWQKILKAAAWRIYEAYSKKKEKGD